MDSLLKLSAFFQVLLVLTKDFVRSEWCILELDIANYESVASNNSKLIILQKEEVPLEMQPQNLRSLLQTRTYIAWSEDEEGQKAFWPKIQRAVMSKTTRVARKKGAVGGDQKPKSLFFNHFFTKIGVRQHSENS